MPFVIECPTPGLNEPHKEEEEGEGEEGEEEEGEEEEGEEEEEEEGERKEEERKEEEEEENPTREGLLRLWSFFLRMQLANNDLIVPLFLSDCYILNLVENREEVKSKGS